MDQEKVMEYQMIEKQIQQLSQTLQSIESNAEEINKIIKSLDDFKNLKKGDKILVPVANGIFAEATLENVDKLKVNVGNHIVVDKNVEGAKKIIEVQLKDLEQYKEETVQYYEQMYEKIQELQHDLMKKEAGSKKEN
ncbi:prefoldin subunit alpha [archaeon]|nr:prefoldin subunit alpha [archaeon]MBL7057313.1 prefoldin subunit alpha [Candidatus Woesearchaeota archaeon]